MLDIKMIKNAEQFEEPKNSLIVNVDFLIEIKKPKQFVCGLGAEAKQGMWNLMGKTLRHFTGQIFF